MDADNDGDDDDDVDDGVEETFHLICPNPTQGKCSVSDKRLHKQSIRAIGTYCTSSSHPSLIDKLPRYQIS